MERVHTLEKQIRTRAFTLIELLIVIAIILILIAIALPNFLEAQIRARVARVSADMRTIATAMESYYQDFKMYPGDHDPDSLFPDEWGLLQLTSPIKYLTALPDDVFNQSGTGSDPGEAAFEMASTGKTPNVIFGLRPKVQAYVVFSHGPDMGDQFNDNNGWPCLRPSTLNPCPNQVGYLRYSPTNGTKSLGELVKPGGEVRSGNYCIDGWEIVRGFNPPLSWQCGG
jgi:prepilin-type N-terminal cleavage/methylation domain-containing protein